MIFVVLGKTSGLAWEVIKYEEYWSKYIFYVPDKTTLDYWIKLTNNEGNTKLSNILSDIELKNNGIAFCIENNIDRGFNPYKYMMEEQFGLTDEENYRFWKEYLEKENDKNI